MESLAEQLALKERLPRTWPAFFGRYGHFTALQLAGIPALLEGVNVLLCAATASGKTETALAPLIERHCPPARERGLHILYLAPTRALASDLHSRLAHPLEMLGLTLAIKTSDRSSFRATRPPDLLLTTPESCDSLLAAQAGLLANLRAIVIDELHLLDGSPRGDHLRALLRRIHRVRVYAAGRGEAPDEALQLVALSATMDNPAAVAARYLGDPRAIVVPGGRTLESELIALSPIGADELRTYLGRFRARGWRKALVFCNSRAEVEAYAAAVRNGSPFGAGVFVHYSNIDARRRHEIEQQFATAEAAICFASSTLELGIDIGTIDLVMLVGPPGSPASFSQRVGRAGRRSGRTRVACFYRTDLERVLFETLLGAARAGLPDPTGEPAGDAALASAQPFRPAVAIQQIFSLIKQSPTAAVRPAELAELFSGLLTRQDLEAILGELEQRGYLRPGRPGEWRAGARLNELIDSQASSQPGPSIYSNIRGTGAHLYNLRDQQTGQTLAQVDALWLSQEGLTIEGRPISVEWSDGEVVLVRARPGAMRGLVAPLYRSARQPLSYELAQLVPAHFGLVPGAAPLILEAKSWLWFHWLGEIYGRALLDLLRYQASAEETEQIGLCVRLGEALREPPQWSANQARRYLEDSYRVYEPLLDLGPFQHLLPLHLRKRAVVEQFDIERFLSAAHKLRPMQADERRSAELSELVGI